MGRLNVYNLPHLVFVGSDFSIVEPEHIEQQRSCTRSVLLVVPKPKIPALLLNIEFLDVSNIDTVLAAQLLHVPCQMCNQVGPLQQISEILGMIFIIGTSEEDGDGVQRLSLEILS